MKLNKIYKFSRPMYEIAISEIHYNVRKEGPFSDTIAYIDKIQYPTMLYLRKYIIYSDYESINHIIFEPEWNNWINNLCGDWSVYNDSTKLCISFEKEEDFVLYNLTWIND